MGTHILSSATNDRSPSAVPCAAKGVSMQRVVQHGIRHSGGGEMTNEEYKQGYPLTSQ